jgi:heavy metal sensor kinase
MSLSTRLSVFFLAVLSVVLGGVSLSVYLLARAYLHGQADERLLASLTALAAAVESEADGLDWEPEAHQLTLGQDPGPYQVRWEVRDERGRLVGRSANLGGQDLWPAEARPPHGVAGRRQAERDGQSWQLAWRRVTAEPRPPGAPPAVAGRGSPGGRYAALVLTVGINLERRQEALGRLALALVVLSSAIWLTVALAGRLICRRALAPLHRMARAAREMGAAHLDERLPSPGTGDELEKLGQAFNDLLSRLAEAFERQRRFAADASHQLRTPLAALRGQVEVALRRPRPAEEYREGLAQVAAEAGRLQQILEALLFLARADADAEVGPLEAVDLAEWLPGQLRSWAGHARAADLRLKCDGPLRVRAQPVLLGQALDNLIDNACKYSAPGSPVVVSLGAAEVAGGPPGRPVAALAVQDAGRGIGPADQPHVFEPFFRSAESRRLGQSGVGLGLAVVRRIAAALGGSVTAESRPGQGSRFTLRLPLLEESKESGHLGP